MDIADAKTRLAEAEASLKDHSAVRFADFDTPFGSLRVLVTDRLRRKCRKGRVWKTPQMLSALKNAAYGFNSAAPRSRGGADGLFVVDRSFRPANSMTNKLFDQFIDKPDGLVTLLEDLLGTDRDAWIPVRLVSHHMRLLGVLSVGDPGQLVLVDYDDHKGG